MNTEELKQSLNEFVEKYTGTYQEVAGSANAKNQCVDLANLFIREVFKKQIIEWTNAIDFPSRLDSDYTFTKNTPNEIPNSGAVIVWGAPYGRYTQNKVTKYAGHIAVVVSADINSVTVFEQNYPTGKPCQIGKHSYHGCLGWFELPITQGSMSENLQETLITNFGVKTLDELKMVWDKEMKNLKDSRDLIEELRIKLKESENGYSSAQKLLSDEKKSHYQDFELLAEMLGATKNDDLTLFRKNIEGKIETCITFEDKARDLEKKLERERAQYASDLKALSTQIEKLKKDLSDAEEEVRRLNEEKPEPIDTQLKPPTLIGILIDYIKGLFK